MGFHGQQAAEKLLKAVLADAGITYPITHRLAELIDLTNDAGLSFPESLDDIRFLTPFAVEFRYDILPKEQENPPFGRIYFEYIMLYIIYNKKVLLIENLPENL
ncbi:MAG: HEPN domain-containing protein [Euryarchaeota archaeon]|nr:HEPN domain-containing protein [Euryarchaeota archaeon]